MSTIRDAYLDLATQAVNLLGRRELGDHWNDPSALPEFSIRGLAGHLARAILQVEWFLDMPEPDPPTITAEEYYAELVGFDDVNSDLNVGIRERALQTTTGGWARAYLDASKVFDRLTERLPEVPAERRVLVFGGRALPIDEYLKTRVVELALHSDDLARSLGLPTPALSLDAGDVAISVLVGAARLRHGDIGVLYALARREQDAAQALRVL